MGAFKGADVPRTPGKEEEKVARFVTPGALVFKPDPLVAGTSISTLFSKLKSPEANSLNASTSIRNRNASDEVLSEGICNATSGSIPPQVSKLPMRAQPTGRSTNTSTLGNTLPHTPALGRPTISTFK